MNDQPLNPEEYQLCLELLQRISDHYVSSNLDQRFHSLVRKVYKQGKRHIDGQRAHERKVKRDEDMALLATARLVQIQSDRPAALPEPKETRRLHNPEYCYICKQPYHDVHFFYHFLCPACAEFNYRMRELSADLRGRTALVTGGRVKIGNQLVLRLLRDGARVIVTTRFPQTAARRFMSEPDCAQWEQRLHIYGLDLRNLPAVEAFATRLLECESSLDIVVHNAAQTIQRPPGFYQELLRQEQQPLDSLPPSLSAVVKEPTRELSPIDATSLMPAARDVLPLNDLHDWEERADSRNKNSWLLPLEEVSTQELLEVQLVNSIAPFVLNARLKPLLVRSPHARRFIVNVSAMEGQFARHKTEFHPHTNMAKAALNMMTHTSAAAYAREGIYMNAVDTGWVTDENPTPIRLRKQQELGFFAPLDIVDGMARIYHPIAAGINEPQEPIYGQFLKDYTACKW